MALWKNIDFHVDVQYTVYHVEVGADLLLNKASCTGRKIESSFFLAHRIYVRKIRMVSLNSQSVR